MSWFGCSDGTDAPRIASIARGNGVAELTDALRSIAESQSAAVGALTDRLDTLAKKLDDVAGRLEETTLEAVADRRAVFDALEAHLSRQDGYHQRSSARTRQLLGAMSIEEEPAVACCAAPLAALAVQRAAKAPVVAEQSARNASSADGASSAASRDAPMPGAMPVPGPRRKRA